MSDTGMPERRVPGTHWPETLPDPEDVEPETDEGVLRDVADGLRDCPDRRPHLTALLREANRLSETNRRSRGSLP